MPLFLTIPVDVDAVANSIRQGFSQLNAGKIFGAVAVAAVCLALMKLLLAVLEKRGGLMVSTCDAYINVIGGLFLDEPAADLAMVVALASSFRDKPVPNDLAAIGEVGLTGELRSVNALGQRLSEVRRLGFTKCLVPYRTGGKVEAPEGLQLIKVRNIREALAVLL